MGMGLFCGGAENSPQLKTGAGCKSVNILKPLICRLSRILWISVNYMICEYFSEAIIKIENKPIILLKAKNHSWNDLKLHLLKEIMSITSKFFAKQPHCHLTQSPRIATHLCNRCNIMTRVLNVASVSKMQRGSNC